jgi:hypothetical protein
VFLRGDELDFRPVGVEPAEEDDALLIH